MTAVSGPEPPEVARVARPRPPVLRPPVRQAALHVPLQERAEFFRMLGLEVDLVGLAVERERHRLVRLATVEVIDKKDLNLLCHGISFHR